MHFIVLFYKFVLVYAYFILFYLFHRVVNLMKYENWVAVIERLRATDIEKYVRSHHYVNTLLNKATFTFDPYSCKSQKKLQRFYSQSMLIPQRAKLRSCFEIIFEHAANFSSGGRSTAIHDCLSWHLIP